MISNKIQSTKTKLIVDNFILKELLYSKKNRQIWKSTKINDAEKKYTIKLHFPHSELDINNFKNEVLLLLESQSPYILSITDYKIKPIEFNNNKVQFIVYPFIENSLAENNIGKNNTNIALIFFQQLIEAVHSLHKKKIVHRDLKPENILLNNNQPILSDFGQAIKIKNYLYFNYLAKKEDIYNLAKILLYLLTNIRLRSFSEINTEEICILLSPQKNTEKYFENEALIALVLKMIHKKVRKRPNIYSIRNLLNQIIELNKSNFFAA